MNFTIIVGRIKEEPVIEQTTNGLQFCNLLVETLDGENKDAEVFKITLWKQVADYIKENGKVGAPVAVRARLRPNNYKKESGETLYRSEIVGEKITLMNLD